MFLAYGTAFTDVFPTITLVLDTESLIDLAHQQQPRAILIEVQAENESLDLIQALHQHRVVALTPPELRQAALDVGATELLTAPLDPIELRVRLETLTGIDPTTGQQIHFDMYDILGSLDVLMHDFNNPIGIVAYGLDFAREISEEEDVLPEIRELIDNMLVANRRLRFMIEDMLDFFRLQTNALPISSTPIELTRVIEEATRNIRKVAEPNDISIKSTVPPNHARPLGDIRLFQRVINAALDTAVKFCQPNSTITINASADDETVTIVISDPGQPIHPDFTSEQLLGLARTSQAREAKSRSSVGMSLPFCRVAMEQMNGTLELDSDSETGLTSLTLRLPCSKG